MSLTGFGKEGDKFRDKSEHTGILSPDSVFGVAERSGRGILHEKTKPSLLPVIVKPVALIIVVEVLFGIEKQEQVLSGKITEFIVSF